MLKDKEKFYIFAHNDWAQYMAEAGVFGIGASARVFGFYLFKTLKLWSRRKTLRRLSGGVACCGPGLYRDSFLCRIQSAYAGHCFDCTSMLAIGYAALHLERHHQAGQDDLSVLQPAA